MSRLFTSESVMPGHPDKMCDRIADEILDAIIEAQPTETKNLARSAVEVMALPGMVVIGGEVTCYGYVDIPAVARKAIKAVGYDGPAFGFDGSTCGIVTAINEQSPDIAQAVNREGLKSLGAGDQGLMFGYACDETEQLMPLPITLAHRLALLMSGPGRGLQANDGGPLFGPDGKTQVTVEYNEKGEPVGIDTIVVSVQHRAETELEEINAAVNGLIIADVRKQYPEEWFSDCHVMVNPSGRFVRGGPNADSGLTGRKIIVDTYGGMARHGGGSFCVDGETEYLTPTGWKKIRDYAGEEIAQWEPDRLTFVRPQQWIKTPAQGLMRITTPDALDMVVSENHDIVLVSSKGNIVKKRAKDLFPGGKIQEGNAGFIPTSFIYSNEGPGVDMSDDAIRLQVAFCADGSLNGEGKGRVRVLKERKVARMHLLLTATGTPYATSKDKDYTIFRFAPPAATKLLSDIFWSCNSRQLAIIAEECLLWDGSQENGIYRTTRKCDADFVQFAFMATYGSNASIVNDDRIGEAYGSEGRYIRKAVCYEVHRKKNKVTGLRCKRGLRKNFKLDVNPFASEDPDMYCFTVDSGMLLLRRNNRVFVTGNSGKDPTKLDRSGAYMARHIAKSVVASHLARRCEVQLAYAIGRPEPVSLRVDTFGTSVRDIDDRDIENEVVGNFDLTPGGIIKSLRLFDSEAVRYANYSAFGHFGRFMAPWEEVKKLEVW